jgi:CDGSH-type Zn-finger protein
MTTSPDMKIVVTPDGPYRVTGEVPLTEQVIENDDEGNAWEWREGRRHGVPSTYNLCRCGRSATKPFCDRSHARVGFDGTETADRTPYADAAEVFEGPEMYLTDAPSLCSIAQFCDARGDAWHLVEQSQDEGSREVLEHEATRCPSGRLVAWRGTARDGGVPVEPEMPGSIGLVRGPGERVAGPLWVRGGIRIESADGTPYEARNRVTLCRCGESGNKPFCDGSHLRAGFRDDP